MPRGRLAREKRLHARSGWAGLVPPMNIPGLTRIGRAAPAVRTAGIGLCWRGLFTSHRKNSKFISLSRGLLEKVSVKVQRARSSAVARPMRETLSQRYSVP